MTDETQTINIQLHHTGGELGEVLENVPLTDLGLEKIPPPGAVTDFLGKRWEWEGAPRPSQAGDRVVAEVFHVHERP